MNDTITLELTSDEALILVLLLPTGADALKDAPEDETAQHGKRLIESINTKLFIAVLPKAIEQAAQIYHAEEEGRKN